MRVTRLRLRNFVGVRDGAGLDEVDLAFDESVPPIVMLFGMNGSGKAQPLDSIVYTAEGPKTIGKIRIGDEIYGRDGRLTRVAGVFPQGELDELRVEFNDGTHVLCSGDHLFKVMEMVHRLAKGSFVDQGSKERLWFREKIITAREIMEGSMMRGNTARWYIPMANPVVFPDKEVPIHPYVMGCLLGDGTFRNGGGILFSCAQKDILDRASSFLREGYSFVRVSDVAYDYRITGRGKGITNHYSDASRKMGMWGKFSYEKFVPDVYKYNSPEVRLSVLQGMFDCDGSVEKGFHLQYYTSSPALVEDVRFLVESLGGTVRHHTKRIFCTYKGVRKEGKLGHRLTIKLPAGMLPFTSEKKRSQYIAPEKYVDPHRKILQIVPTGRKVEMACIKISNDDCLYLTNNFIVTHNTSILSMMHPGSESFDDRKDLIVEGRDGEKLVCIRDGDDEYEAEHFYSKDGKVKSFLRKNGADLNPSGGVRGFAAAAEEHMGFTPDFFKVGKIGSNVVNFVDMTSSDRKRFISRFMPNIEAWLGAGKIASKKYTGLRKTMSFLSDELGKLDTASNLADTTGNAGKVLEAHRGRVADLNARLSGTEGGLSGLPEWSVGPNPHAAEVAATISALTEAESTKAKYESQFPTLAGASVGMMTEKLVLYDAEISSHNERAAAIDAEAIATKARTDSLSSSIERRREELRAIRKSSREASKIEVMITEANRELEEAQADLEKYPLPNVAVSMTLAQASVAKGSIWSVFETVRAAVSEASHDALSALAAAAGDSAEQVLQREQTMAARKVQRAREKLDTKRSIVGLLKGQAETARALQSRPKACKIDSCLFVASAVRFKDTPAQLTEAEIALVELEAADTDAKTEMDAAADAARLVITLKKSFDQLSSVSGTGAYPVSASLASFGEFLAMISDGIPSVIAAFDVSKAFAAFQARETVTNMGRKIEELGDRLAAARSSEELAVAVESDVGGMEDELAGLNETIERLRDERSDVAAKASAARRKKEIISELKAATEAIGGRRLEADEAGRKHSEAERILAEARSMRTEAETIRRSIRTAEAEVSPAQKLYDDARLKLARREEYEAHLVILQGQFQAVKDVKDAMDPVKGVPTLLISRYLGGIETLANSLLDVAYGGAFRISFRLTDTDFFIEVRKEDGGFCPDVKVASQGQTAMIKTALSLAIFESALGRYNILCLDEIDSTLDDSNRRLFLDILERQIVELGLEQLFCISHNDSFTNGRVGLILLPGHTVDLADTFLMSNKRLVADLSGGERST